MDLRVDDRGVDHEGHDDHAAHQDEQEHAVFGEDAQTARGHGVVDQAQHAEGGEGNHDADDGLHGVGDVAHDLFGGFARGAQGDADQDGPGEDAEEVGLGEGFDRVGDDAREQVGHDLSDAARGGFVDRVGQGEVQGHQIAGEHGHDAGEEGAQKVEQDDPLHGAGLLGIAEGGNDEEEDQDGGHGLQGGYEQGAQKHDAVKPWNHQGEEDADGQTAGDTPDQAPAVPRFPCFFHTVPSVCVKVIV